MTDQIQPDSVQRLMAHFQVQHLVFTARARDAVIFGPQPGTAIRGALYNTLCELFSPNDPIPGLPYDPVRELLEAEDESAARGRNIPRAFSIEPPLGRKHIPSGEGFEFGVSLFGRQIALMPYIIRGVREMGKVGLGRGRGQFDLMRVSEINRLNDTRRVLMQYNRFTQPRLVVTQRHVEEEARLRNMDQVGIRFLTPMRLVDSKNVVGRPLLRVILQRLLERAQALVEYYRTPEDAPYSREDWLTAWERMSEVGAEADNAGKLSEAVRWVQIESYSARRKSYSPIGGFVGEARWRLTDPEALRWLLWGQCLHIGKNAPKGDGWYILK